MLGEPLIQANVELAGELVFGEESLGQAVIWNRSPQPAKIIGIARSCRCFDIGDASIAQIIPANDRLSLPLVIKPNKLGPLHQRVEIFLDHPEQFRVNVNVFGSVQGVD